MAWSWNSMTARSAAQGRGTDVQSRRGIPRCELAPLVGSVRARRAWSGTCWASTARSSSDRARPSPAPLPTCALRGGQSVQHELPDRHEQRPFRSFRPLVAMTMLDQNRASTQLARKAGTDITAVKNLAIWGNTARRCIRTSPTPPSAGARRQRSSPRGNGCRHVHSHGPEAGRRDHRSAGTQLAASAANAVVDTVRAITPSDASRRLFQRGPLLGWKLRHREGLIFSYPSGRNGCSLKSFRGCWSTSSAAGPESPSPRELKEEKSSWRNCCRLVKHGCAGSPAFQPAGPVASRMKPTEPAALELAPPKGGPAQPV